MNPTLDTRLGHRHRPSKSPVMFQRWDELAFLHWRWDPAEIQATLPPGLQVDTFEGDAWLGVVPFFMRSVRPRFCPSVPWLSHFLELNLRTYVFDEQGRSGVWFYSLDCNQPLAVWTARTFFHLPYEHARMNADATHDGWVRYGSRRDGDDHDSEFVYRASRQTHPAEPGSLEFFLAERYLLFANTPGGLRVGQVHHKPYPLGEVDLAAWDDRVIRLNGFESPGRAPDHVIGSPGVTVDIFPLTT